MSRADPAAAQRDGPVVDAGKAEALEAFDRADDVHQGIHRTHLVQRHRGCRHTVDAPLGLAQQGEGPNRSFAYPG